MFTIIESICVKLFKGQHVRIPPTETKENKKSFVKFENFSCQNLRAHSCSTFDMIMQASTFPSKIDNAKTVSTEFLKFIILYLGHSEIYSEVKAEL